MAEDEILDLNSGTLSAHWDVMKYYYFECKKRRDQSTKYPSVSAMSSFVIDKVKYIWKKYSIPVVTDQRIEKIIKDDQKLKNTF